MNQWGPDHFQTTRWSVVIEARSGGGEAREALGILCECYWYPLYTFARRSGWSAHDAEDLVQGFLLMLIERELLQAVDREKGFRLDRRC
ncbi:MAG: hypothetical protein AAF492_06155 [Verrucomicrobiota bacterium]